MNTPKPDSELMLDTLKQAVAKALDKKRRLGQYAVLWKNGQPTFTEGDRPKSHQMPSAIHEDSADYNSQAEPSEEEGKNESGQLS